MDLALFTKVVPHCVALGIEMVSLERGAGRAVLRQPWRPELIGDPDRAIVHGGVITTLLDTLGGVCTFAAAGNVMPQATLDLRVDYLRPARAPLDLLAEGHCYRVTRHIAFVRGLCHQGEPDDPIAQMTATFVLADHPDLVAGPKS
jgi:uncharacterized protein (TIGR00369 family)